MPHTPTFLRLKQPATRWVDGLPIGNGRLGAMLLGPPEQARLALNHEALWRGVDRHLGSATTAPEHLEAIRQALFARDFVLARELCDQHLSGPDPVEAATRVESIQPYQPLGDLLITDPNGSYALDYERQLDLASATAESSFTINDERFQQRCFASVPDQVLVIQLTGDRPGAITCGLRLERRADPGCQLTCDTEPDAISLHGRFVEGITFAARAEVTTEGGTITPSGAADLLIHGADSVTVRLAMAVAADPHEPEPLNACRQCLQDAPSAFAELQARHLAEYRPLWDACRLDLPTPAEAAELPLDARLARRRQGDSDPGLDALYFHYGRYLLLASSRACELPANLQGIWNDDPRPAWNSDFHIDINLQMAYWPAESTGLGSCTEPLVRYLEAMMPGAREAARNYYGCRGIHMGTGDRWQLHAYLAAGWDIWPSGGPWLAQHFWWRWHYSRDLRFLREHAYPFLLANADFLEDFLVHDAEGRLVTAPSQSPENTFVGGTWPVSYCTAPTMDLVLAREIFSRCLEASELLAVDSDRRDEWRRLLAELPPFQIGRHGQLQEWLDDEEEDEPGHRHLSHLIGAYPGDLMTPERLPEAYAGARVALARRYAAGAGQSGWSRAWCTALWARFGEAEKAYTDLTDLLLNHTTASLINTHPIATHGGCVVQLDGNFGGTAAIVEMLLQHHDGALHLLPALPAAWPDGAIHGLHAPGNVSLDITWRHHQIVHVTLRAPADRSLLVRLPRPSTVEVTGASVTDRGAEQLALQSRGTAIELRCSPLASSEESADASH